MPTAAFIVTLDLRDLAPGVLDATATDIGESLFTDGFDVVEVKPYQHPSLDAPTQFGGLDLPPLDDL